MARPGTLVPGAIYLERRHPVMILARWGRGGGPRNVLIERADGTKVVRPFRGLRKPKEPDAARNGYEKRAHPDEVYWVTLCLRCRHPGGQHVLDAGCRLCGCAGWWASPSRSAWSDRMTREAELAGDLPLPQEGTTDA